MLSYKPTNILLGNIQIICQNDKNNTEYQNMLCHMSEPD